MKMMRLCTISTASVLWSLGTATTFAACVTAKANGNKKTDCKCTGELYYKTIACVSDASQSEQSLLFTTGNEFDQQAATRHLRATTTTISQTPPSDHPMVEEMTCPAMTLFQWLDFLHQNHPHCHLAPIRNPTDLQRYNDIQRSDNNAATSAAILGVFKNELEAFRCQERQDCFENWKNINQEPFVNSRGYWLESPNGFSDNNHNNGDYNAKQTPATLATVAELNPLGHLNEANWNEQWRYAMLECCAFASP